MEDQDSQVSNIQIQNPNSQSGHDPAESQSWPPLKIEEGGFPSIPFQVKNGDEEVCVCVGGSPYVESVADLQGILSPVLDVDHPVT